MRTLIINSNNLVSTPYNDTYQYRFPIGSVHFKNDQIAVSSISMYYSWENITSSSEGGQYNNNSFQYSWLGTTITITLPTGYYEIDGMNAYLQSQMVANKHYLIDSNGDYVYYLEIVQNSTYYAVGFNCYAIPTSAQATTLGYTQPSSPGWSFPATATTPQFIVLSTNNFKSVVGFSAGTYPPATQSSNYSVISNNGVPQITPVSSLIMTCSLLNNSYSIPSTLMYSFSPNVSYGSQIQISPPEMSFVDIQDGSYNDFQIVFFDQNLNRISIQDTNLVILLTVKNKNEYVDKILN